MVHFVYCMKSAGWLSRICLYHVYIATYLKGIDKALLLLLLYNELSTYIYLYVYTWLSVCINT